MIVANGPSVETSQSAQPGRTTPSYPRQITFWGTLCKNFDINLGTYPYSNDFRCVVNQRNNAPVVVAPAPQTESFSTNLFSLSPMLYPRVRRHAGPCSPSDYTKVRLGHDTDEGGRCVHYFLSPRYCLEQDKRLGEQTTQICETTFKAIGPPRRMPSRLKLHDICRYIGDLYSLSG